MKRHLRFIVYIALVFGLLAVFTRLLESPEGEVLSELEFTTYDNVLYTPEELHALTPEQLAAGHIGWDYDYHDKEFSRVRTNIIRLGLTPGKTYKVAVAACVNGTWTLEAAIRNAKTVTVK